MVRVVLEPCDADGVSGERVLYASDPQPVQPCTVLWKRRYGLGCHRGFPISAIRKEAGDRAGDIDWGDVNSIRSALGFAPMPPEFCE